MNRRLEVIIGAVILGFIFFVPVTDLRIKFLVLAPILAFGWYLLHYPLK